MNNKVKDKDEIIWTKRYELGWNNFKGVVPNNSTHSAISFIGIKVIYKGDYQIKKVKTYCYFSQSKSWVKEKSDFGLSHEQLHFDIGEYNRRLLQNEFNVFIKKNALIRPYEVDSFYSISLKKLSQMQELFDKETNHSKNPFKQIDWENKINSLLKNSE